jgi:nucleoside-diphosphate-sugar epimerase
MVLGAAGFIGDNVVAALETEGGNVVSCVGRSGPRQRGRGGPALRAAEVEPSTWVRLDLARCAVEEFEEVLAAFQPDAVINCVGLMEGTSRELLEANTRLVATVLQALQLGAPHARLVQIGSAAEYGAVAVGKPIAEGQCTRPASEYGISKLAATQLVLNAHMAGRVDAVALRVFNPIGPQVAASSVLGRAAHQIGRAMTERLGAVTMGSLEAYRDFVDVRDVARAVIAAARAPRREPDDAERLLFNVAGGAAVQVRRAVRLLADAAGFEGAIQERAAGSPRSGAVPWQRADIGRAAAHLAWAPSIPLPASVQAVWEAYGPN